MNSLLRVLSLSFCTLFFLTSTGFAVVRDDRIEDVPGLRFENIVYGGNRIFVDVVNMTNRNIQFGGTMAFLDPWGRQLANAQLLPRRVSRNGVTRYIGYFTSGSGEAARRGVKVLWDLWPR